MKSKILIAICVVLFLFFSCENEEFKQGYDLFLTYCSSCHLERGQGLRGLYPALANSDYLKEHQADIACIIKYGMEGEIVVNGKKFNQKMIGFKDLSDFEITNIINYINHSWGNDYGYVKFVDVKESLQNCEQVRNKN